MVDVPPPSHAQQIAEALHAAGLEPSLELAVALNAFAGRMWSECTPAVGQTEAELAAAASDEALAAVTGRAAPP